MWRSGIVVHVEQPRVAVLEVLEQLAVLASLLFQPLDGRGPIGCPLIQVQTF
jgi:hypothetical protein